MDRASGAIAVVAIVVVLAGGALLFGTVGGGTETSFTEEVPFEAIPTDGSAIVFGLAQEGGLELIGVRLQRPTYTVDVGLAVPPECVVAGGTDQLLTDEGPCADLPVHGPVVGGGVTQTGDRVVTVRLTISEDCADAVVLGSTWPPPVAACAETHTGA